MPFQLSTLRTLALPTALALFSLSASAEESKLQNALNEKCSLKGEVPVEQFEFEVELPGNDQKNSFELIQVFCDRAAYNTSEMWILKDQYGEEQILSFSTPSIYVAYANESEQKTVEDIVITSYGSSVQLSNSSFDPLTLSISSFHKWRGVGDASSAGVWEFREGNFVLKSYEVDASYDGEVNPQTVANFERPTP